MGENVRKSRYLKNLFRIFTCIFLNMRSYSTCKVIYKSQENLTVCLLQNESSLYHVLIKSYREKNPNLWLTRELLLVPQSCMTTSNKGHASKLPHMKMANGDSTLTYGWYGGVCKKKENDFTIPDSRKKNEKSRNTGK